MKHIFKLIRWQNLVMLAIMQLTFRYGFLELQDIQLALNDWQYGLLVLSTVLLAGAGYVINDIFDQETDQDNKPSNVIVGKSISEAKAYNIYVIMNITGVGIGFYLSNVIYKPGFATIFILIASTLYFYATSLKQMMIIGNIIIAALLAISVLIIAVFDLFPVTYIGNQQTMANLFSVISDYAIFAFIINLIREIVKDIEDVNGDYNQGMNTLPITLGVSRTSKLVFALSVVPIALVLNYINSYFISNSLYAATIYALIFVVSPLIYFTIKMWSAKTPKDFRHLSTILKLVIFFGIISIAVVTLNIKYA